MIRLEALGKGMITGAAVSALSIAFLMFSGYDLDSAAPVIMAISFAAAGALIGFNLPEIVEFLKMLFS
jgi:hypothetical protein